MEREDGPEAQSEVTTSRILWAIGFTSRRRTTSTWTMTGAQAGEHARPISAEVEGRRSRRRLVMVQNPFIGSRPYAGLVVANLILNNWDWKTSNNKIYSTAIGAGDGGTAVRRP